MIKHNNNDSSGRSRASITESNVENVSQCLKTDKNVLLTLAIIMQLRLPKDSIHTT